MFDLELPERFHVTQSERFERFLGRSGLTFRRTMRPNFSSLLNGETPPKYLRTEKGAVEAGPKSWRKIGKRLKMNKIRYFLVR